MHAGEGYFTLEFSVNKKPKKNRFEIPSALCAFFRACVGLCGFSDRIALCGFPLPSASAEKENTMSWNNAQRRKKFEENWAKEEVEFRAAGMTEEQIQSMREFEEEQFRSDRRYHMHTQPLQVCEFDEDDSDESDNSLFKDFIDVLAVEFDPFEDNSRYGWVEKIQNEDLANRLRMLSKNDLELITQLTFDELTQSEVAEKMGCNQSVISRKVSRIKKFLRPMS